MSSADEDEEQGPSVESTDMEERIAARRLRMKKRAEMLRRAQLGEDPDAKLEVKEEVTKSRKQMEVSRIILTKLREDADEMVSNVRVAGDAREALRRADEEDARRQRKDRLEAEHKAGTEKFEEVTRKWESALQKEIPQDLQEMLMQQKQACDSMIDEKNKLINDFQMELKTKDDQYVKDLKKMGEDIDLMIERMDEQVHKLTASYRSELNQVEKAFMMERNELLGKQKRTWEGTMQNRREKEVEFMNARTKRVEDYEQQLQHLRVQDAEEYNTVKIKLETDVQVLQQQLQQMKATYQLNQEKLEYNFIVLRKRDEENTITKSQQKRKITRLQDVLTNLKIKAAKQEKQYRDENTNLSEDYKRITEQFKELQKKSKHFIATDAKKFHDVWCMNEEEAKELARKVLEQDRIIHEQQLGLQWYPPDIEFMENVGPLMTGRGNTVTAHQVVQEVMAATNNTDPTGSDHRSMDGGQAGTLVGSGGQAGTGEAGQTAGSHRSIVLQKYAPQLVKNILELLCDESGFLIEQKLNTLLSPLERDEQCLMKLDAIFTALHVESEDDIHMITSYFVEELEKELSRKASSETSLAGEQAATTTAAGTTESGKAATDDHHPHPPGHEGGHDIDDVDREIEGVTGMGEEGQSPRSCASSVQQGKAGQQHQTHKLIHPNAVLKALRRFVEENKQPAKHKQGAGAQFKISSESERDDTRDAEYWVKYPEVINKHKENLWDALIEALEKYSEELKRRSNLIVETDGLRQQNAELRMLLNQYFNSKVNQELEIPPTRVLQLELNQ